MAKPSTTCAEQYPLMSRKLRGGSVRKSLIWDSKLSALSHYGASFVRRLPNREPSQ
jgi:hypothetical protein